MNAKKKRKLKQRQGEPSKASLREIPEVDFKTAKVRRNSYAARIAADGLVVQVERDERVRKSAKRMMTVHAKALRKLAK